MLKVSYHQLCPAIFNKYICSGKAIALRLARDGFDVCVNDLEANSGLVKKVRLISIPFLNL